MSTARSRSGGSWIGNTLRRVIEILAEGLLADRLEQVAIGRRDDSHVDPLRHGPSDRIELVLLQHAQQLGLRA